MDGYAKVASVFSYYKTEILVSIILILAVSYFWQRRKIYALAWKCTGPVALPIFGNIFSFGITQKSFVASYQQMCLKYPRMIRVWLLNNLVLLLTDPEDIYNAFGNPKLIQRSKDHTKMFDMVGKGVFAAPPEQWKTQRKILNPLFSLENMYCYLKVVNEKSTILCEQLEAKLDTGEFDVYTLIAMCTTDIFIENTLGLKLQIQNEDSRIYFLCKEGSNYLFAKCLYHLLGNTLGSYIFSKTSTGRKYQHMIKEVKHNIFEKAVIKKYTEHYSKKNQEDISNNNICLKTNGVQKNSNEATILDNIIKKEKFTVEEILQQTLTLFVGGSDAVASATSYTILMLAMHPDIQEEVYCELHEIFGDSDRSVTAENLSNLKYLDRVINETLRLFPVPYHATRETTEEIQIGSLTVPPGVSLFLNMLTLHRDPRYWPDPLKFDPDRFLPNEIEKRHKGYWVPFSLGPRNCIAFKYGIMIMKVMLSYVFRKYKFRTSIKKVEDIEMSFHLLLRNVTGYNVTIQRRKS